MKRRDMTRRRRKRGRLLFLSAIIAGVALAGAGGTYAAVAPGVHSGTLDCTQLEQLWRAGGGSSSTAFMAAEIARAESSGEQYATDHDANGSVDYGYWQINSSNGGSPASYDPETNARQAVAVYDSGGWWQWITYRHGAEIGQC
jgi:hypothetical protein